MATIPKTYLNHSTVYSPSEIVLLKWIEGVNTMVRKERRAFINFSTELRDGLSFASILHLYSDNSARPLRLMKDSGLNEDDIRINMAALRESMVELNLNYIPSSVNIVGMDNLQGLLFSSHLFLVMPYYMPKEAVEFQCVLNDTVMKKIILNNPSQKRISYNVSLEGSADFAIIDENLTIEPSGRAEFPVSFFARISKPVQARISFKGNSEGATQAAPVVFDLVSKVVGRRSVDRQEINDVKLYNGALKSIIVKNPFEKDSEFTVSLIHVPGKRLAKRRALH